MKNQEKTDRKDQIMKRKREARYLRVKEIIYKKEFAWTIQKSTAFTRENGCGSIYVDTLPQLPFFKVDVSLVYRYVKN